MFTIDTAPVLQAVNDMLRKIGEFKRVDLPAEMTDWQSQDVHRERPFTIKPRGRPFTRFWPRSRKEVKASRRARVRYARYVAKQILAKAPTRARRRKHKKKPPRLFRRWSTRPILRAEMIARLQERSTTLMKEKLSWL